MERNCGYKVKIITQSCHAMNSNTGDENWYLNIQAFRALLINYD